MASPSQQVCTISRGAGEVQTTDISDIEIICVTGKTVGGVVNGLAGSGNGLVLQYNGGDDLTITQGGSFRFNLAAQTGDVYVVTILTQPSGPMLCTVVDGSGTVGSTDVSNITVNCSEDGTIGGTVSGLVGKGLKLVNNGTEELSISRNGSFTFASKVSNGGSYAVTVKTQPSIPTQNCSVSKGSGTVNGASITNIAVTCATDSFSIGGSVSGLSGSGLVIQNNGGDNLAISSDGVFTFNNAVLDSGIYNVTILTHPGSPAQFCSVTDGFGSVSGGNISNILINCVTGGSRSVNVTVNGIATPGPGLVLQNNGGDNLEISGNGNFTFSTLLGDGVPYKVSLFTPSGSPNVGCNVKNGSGFIAGADVNDIVVTCLQYRSSGIIESEDFGSTSTPTLVSDALGNVTVVWDQHDGTLRNLWANRYNAGTGLWGTAEMIESDNTGSVEQVAENKNRNVHVDGSGNVIVIWRQHDGSRWNQRANRYNAGTGLWGSAQLIGSGLGDAEIAKSVIDASGNVTAVWSEKSGTRWDQWTNRYIAGTGWGAPEKIETGDGNVSDPTVVIDVLGNVTAIWRQKVSGGTRWDQWANRNSGSGWGSAEKINAEDLGDAFPPSVVIDSLGNVTVVWRQSDGIYENQWANRYVMGSGWSAAEKIEIEDLGDVFPAQLKVDAFGHVMAVWKQFDGARNSQRANRYTMNLGWGEAVKIESEDFGSVEDASIVMDALGNVTAVWSQFSFDNSNLWANRYTVGSGWGPEAEKIEQDDTGNVVGFFYPAVVDSAGHVTTIWTQSDAVSMNHLWTNRYTFGVGWGSPQKIDTEDLGNVLANSYSMVSDATGNVTVVWAQNDGTRWNQWASRYIVGSGWETAKLIENENLGNANFAKLIVDGNGKVTVSWPQFGAAHRNLWGLRID